MIATSNKQQPKSVLVGSSGAVLFNQLLWTMSSICKLPPLNSEETLLRMTLPRPRFGTLTTISYDKSKSGSVPFDPVKLKAYDMRSFRRRYASYQGSYQIIQNFVGPVVHDRPLFLEADDHIDLSTKCICLCRKLFVNTVCSSVSLVKRTTLREPRTGMCARLTTRTGSL